MGLKSMPAKSRMPMGASLMELLPAAVNPEVACPNRHATLRQILAVITLIILQSYELLAASAAGQKFCDFGRLLCDVATSTVRINDTTQTSFDVDPTSADNSSVSLIDTPYIFTLF
jgi:hypothetical protein